jgi:hypothetical protein
VKQIKILLVTLTVLFGAAGSANAAYWKVIYDLQGSTVATIVSAVPSTDLDDVTGTFVIEYDTPGMDVGPITGARLTSGSTKLTMFQTNLGLFLLTGTTNTVLAPPEPDGIIGNITGATITGFSGIPNAVTGGIHCTNGAFQCTAVNFTNTSPKPQTPTVSIPLALGNLVFAGAGPGHGKTFTSTGVTQMITTGPTPVSLVSIYIGKEVSRVLIGGLQLPAMSDAGRYGLVLFLLLGGASFLVLRQSLRKRQTGESNQGAFGAVAARAFDGHS